MREVTKEEFFAIMGPRNVHPRLISPVYSSWETPSGAVLGRSYPGWSNPGDASRYLVAPGLLPAPGPGRDQGDGSGSPGPLPVVLVRSRDHSPE